jgi:haloalkane dehalogenase
MMQRVRTPDERFEALSDFPFVARYADVADPTGGESLRMAYLDEGPADGKVVLLLHGEPSWSYLYRFMIPGLVGAGRRVIAPDLIGFGRSDKPSDREEYTYARHVEWVRELLFDRLDLHDVTFFGQDWGSLIGLRLVAEHPERFARIAIGNGGLPTGDERANAAFQAWQDFSQSAPELHIGNIRRLRRAFPRRVVQGRGSPVPQAGADLAERPGPRRQHRGLGRARGVDQALPLLFLRQ